MKQLLPFIFFIFPCLAFGQLIIKGTVVDAEKNTPVQAASVFLSNTSIGTTANAQGAFELNVPAGKYDLIVSSIGFETYNQTIVTNSLNSALIVKLQPKAKELDNVVIEPFERDGWAQWGQFFIDHFIGTSAFAKECKIKNTGVIKFRKSKKSNELTAIAFEPLEIENKALGYTIKYQLETFTYNFKTHYLLYQGYPFFQQMKGGAAKQKRWADKRKEIYYGSMMHFMRSVFTNTIVQEGFDVRHLYKQPNEEKQRVKALYAQRFKKGQSANGALVQVESSPPADSTAYYERIMRQPDEFNIINKQTLTGDSIAYAVDKATAGLSFDNYLWVNYTKKQVPPEYRRQYPDNGTAMASQVTLLDKNDIEIQANGSFYDPLALLSMGYWSWSEKIAHMLPFDFKVN